VLAEIHRARVERVKELLASTDLPMSEAARQSGFLSPQRMAIVFRKLTGQSPGEYRRQVRRRVSK
jgi:LacI family transcriptional regulator